MPTRETRYMALDGCIMSVDRMDQQLKYAVPSGGRIAGAGREAEYLDNLLAYRNACARQANGLAGQDVIPLTTLDDYRAAVGV